MNHVDGVHHTRSIFLEFPQATSQCSCLAGPSRAELVFRYTDRHSGQSTSRIQLYRQMVQMVQMVQTAALTNNKKGYTVL